MISKSVLKQSFRNNWKLWTILTGILCFFITVVIISLNSLIARKSGDMGRPIMQNLSLDDVLSNNFLGASGTVSLVMIIFLIITGNKLVASEIDRGTMSFTLNAPITRKQIIFTKALFLICSFVAMIIAVGIFGTAISAIVGAKVNLGKFWLVILGCLLFGFATSGICFAASCWFNRSGYSLMIGGGLPAAFFLLSSLSPLLTINNKEFLKYISLNTLFDSGKILALDAGFLIPTFIVMFAIGAVLYTVGIIKFLKKDLPL